jgi:pimeloyl-ACP methyl ester carboxylesterase
MSGLNALLHHRDPRPGKDRLLLVMLPGAGIAAEEFAAQGLVAAAQAGGRIVDVIAAEPDQGLYLEGAVAPVLEQSVIAPARAAGYRRLWLLGISLGGMGALSCAAACPEEIEGLILLAPFIGTHGTIAELTRDGGFMDWRPETSAATPPERRILSWLQERLGGASGPQIWLGHATNDRFAAGHRLLAAALPETQTVLVEGGHDWAAWRAIFQALMARVPLG